MASSDRYLGLTGDEETDRGIIANLIEKHRGKKISGFQQFLEELSAQKKSVLEESRAKKQSFLEEISATVKAKDDAKINLRAKEMRDSEIERNVEEIFRGRPSSKSAEAKELLIKRLKEHIPSAVINTSNPTIGGKKRKTKRRRHSKKKYSFPKKSRKTRYRRRRNSV
jgi:hypothetical protein